MQNGEKGPGEGAPCPCAALLTRSVCAAPLRRGADLNCLRRPACAFAPVCCVPFWWSDFREKRPRLWQPPKFATMDALKAGAAGSDDDDDEPGQNLYAGGVGRGGGGSGQVFTNFPFPTARVQPLRAACRACLARVRTASPQRSSAQGSHGL